VTASPGNRHCANCIGTLSFPIHGSVTEGTVYITANIQYESMVQQASYMIQQYNDLSGAGVARIECLHQRTCIDFQYIAPFTRRSTSAFCTIGLHRVCLCVCILMTRYSVPIHNWHSAGSPGWPFPLTLKYKYIFEMTHIRKQFYRTALGNCYGLKLPKCRLQLKK